MKFLYSLSGGSIPVIREFEIDAKTKFEAGQLVKISTDGAIETDVIGACIGVAAEDHTGEKDILNARNDGTKLRVDITKNGVYAVDAPRIVATGGSASTMICSFENISEDLVGAKLVLVQKGENSVNTASVGSVRKVKSVSISSSDATFTLDTGSVTDAGDVYALMPLYGFKGNISDDGKGFSCTVGSVAADLYVVNYNTDTLTLEVMPDKNYID